MHLLQSIAVPAARRLRVHCVTVPARSRTLLSPSVSSCSCLHHARTMTATGYEIPRRHRGTDNWLGYLYRASARVVRGRQRPRCVLTYLLIAAISGSYVG